MKVSEAIEELTVKRDNSLGFQKLYASGDRGWTANKYSAAAYNTAINTLKQIDEPQAEKVEVPVFVAEKMKYYESALWMLSSEYFDSSSEIDSDELANWIDQNSEKFFRAWLDGYTVKSKRWVVKNKEHIGLESFVNSTINPVWTTEEPLWMTFTDKSKAEAVATLVEGSVEEV